MNKIDELIAQIKKQDEQKPKKVILWILAVIGCITAVAGIAYAVYRYLTPDLLEDCDDEFEDEFDDYFEDEEEDTEL